MFSTRSIWKHFNGKQFMGQFTIVTLVMVFIMLILFAKFYPIMKPFIDDLVDAFIADGDEIGALVVSLIPFMIAIAIVITIFIYAVPRR